MFFNLLVLCKKKALLSVTALISSLLLSACSTPAQRFDVYSHTLGFQRVILQGSVFRHIGYINDRFADGEGLLHIYLDGDGTPWLTPGIVAADPTPRKTLVLNLMAQDGAPSLYLGRPCYHGFSQPPCSPLLWTARRYSPEVVASMAAALRNVLDRSAYSGIVLIGYSGGGALAMLLAERDDRTRMIVTVAGNLDHEQWTGMHNYSPLTGSLNPARRAPLSDKIAQLHLIGSQDNNIDPAVVESVVKKQSYATLLKIIENYNHNCCWETTWQQTLNEVGQLLRAN